MKSSQIKQAAELLEKREEMLALRAHRVTKPSYKLGLYAKDGQDTMHGLFSVSNELGRGLLNIAIEANSKALAELGIEEFTNHIPQGSEESK